MAHVIECDGCHVILKGGESYLTIERTGANGWVMQAFGARSDWDVCSAACLADLAARLLEAQEVPC